MLAIIALSLGSRREPSPSVLRVDIVPLAHSFPSSALRGRAVKMSVSPPRQLVRPVRRVGTVTETAIALVQSAQRASTAQQAQMITAVSPVHLERFQLMKVCIRLLSVRTAHLETIAPLVLRRYPLVHQERTCLMLEDRVQVAACHANRATLVLVLP